MKCSKCGLIKNKNDFYKDKKGKNGYSYWCKECTKSNVNSKYVPKERKKSKWNWSDTREYMREYKKRDPLRTKARKAAERYNISIEEFMDKYIKQETCSICSNLLEKKYLDHDHETNIVRDFLCHGCNLGLGFFKDDKNLLLAAVLYLEKHGSY